MVLLAVSIPIQNDSWEIKPFKTHELQSAHKKTMEYLANQSIFIKIATKKNNT